MSDLPPPEGGPRFPALPSDDILQALSGALAERAPGYDRSADFPAESIELLHRAGVLTSTVGRQCGGPGGTLSDTLRILRALGRGDPSAALIAAFTIALHAGQARQGTWPERLYAEVLAESEQRPTLLNSLQVEPALGTPSRGGMPVSKAVADGRDWRISGHKVYSTGAPGLRWMLVLARTDEQAPRVGSFAVRSDAPGVRIDRTWDHLGLRASRGDDVILDDVRVAEHAVVELAEPGQALASQDPRARLWGNVAFPAIYLGVAEAARAWLVRFLHERVPANLGKPLASLPRFQTAVGEIEARLIEAAELLRGAAARIDAGDPSAGPAARATKQLVGRAVIWSVEYAVSLIGNPGLTRHNALERHYRDILCSRVHFPQDDVVIDELGRAALAAHEG